MPNTKNRLKLDFSLSTNEERAKFAEEYLSQDNFKNKPPTESELETIANYILWGKDPKTGLNAKQSKTIQLESRNKTWDATAAESLDALMETPGFSETSIQSPNSAPLKQSRIVFSREEARKLAPPHILEKLEELWEQIDELDLIINFYDLAHNKRKLEPRKELLNRFSQEDIEYLKGRASRLNQFNYLKLRHLIVELRREQFSLKDYYNPTITSLEAREPEVQVMPAFDADIRVLPVGLKYLDNSKLFPDNRFPLPSDFSEKEIEKIIKEYWARKEDILDTFDFREIEHVYNAFLLLDELKDGEAREDVFSTMKQFLDTLNFYIARADLSDIHKDILDLKLSHWQNQDIAKEVNKKYGKTYNPNYISTIFRHHIIPAINDAAALHEEIVVNLCFEENFKKCRGCGETLLISADNFVRKARSADGFATQCKKCDKKKREARKGELK